MFVLCIYGENKICLNYHHLKKHKSLFKKYMFKEKHD